MHRVVPSLLVVVSLGLVSSLAEAGEPSIDAPDQPPLIAGGVAAGPCQWPTTVVLYNGKSLCTGTLVHPRVVLTAAHCMTEGAGGMPDHVRFGEKLFQPHVKVDVEFCEQNPDFLGVVGASDSAFCVLDSPVNVPVTPPVMGCELAELSVGTEVVIVGFGKKSDMSGVGLKRFGTTQIVEELLDGTIKAGTAEVSACTGDSGGTGYVLLGDGGWRAWGILSGGPAGCGNYGVYVSMHHVVAWIEDHSGYDITPCHDVDGTWNPGPACSGFAATPMLEAEWADDCPDPLGDEPATCGPSFSALADDHEAPIVTIVDPADQAVFPEVPSAFDITVEADDGEGFAVLKVELYIDGELIRDHERGAEDPPDPWVFDDAEFLAGTYTLTARAYDYVGNVGESQAIAFAVGDGDDGDGDGGDGDDGDGDGNGDGDGDETSNAETGGSELGTDGAGVDGRGEQSCACTQPERGSEGRGILSLAAFVLVLGLRRRSIRARTP